MTAAARPRATSNAPRRLGRRAHEVTAAILPPTVVACLPRARQARRRQHNPNQPTVLENYYPVLLFILFGFALGCILLGLGWGLSSALGVNRPDSEKLSPYECGFEAFEDARMKFDVRYYLVAILFILFDLEIAFLFPWAITLNEIGGLGFWAMMLFLGILVVGFIYEWKKGALEWE
jgi:NADH-quinone oxidoreductase subunit A